MKKYLKHESLIRAEVPQELDLRILAAARMRQGAGVHRRRKIRLISGSIAAAAAVSLVAGLCLMPVKQTPRKMSQEEYSRLMAMTDWTVIEQENYNLSGEISSGSNQLTDLTEYRNNSGV